MSKKKLISACMLTGKVIIEKDIVGPFHWNDSGTGYFGIHPDDEDKEFRVEILKYVEDKK